MIQMAFSTRLGKMSLKELEHYKNNLQHFKHMLNESLEELAEERRRVDELIDAEYAK